MFVPNLIFVKCLARSLAHRKQLRGFFSKQTNINQINKKLAHLPLLLTQIRKDSFS